MLLQQVEEPAAAVDVVVGEVELGDPRVLQRQAVLGAVALDELVLDDPVDLGVDQARGRRTRRRSQRALPQVEDLLVDRVARRPSRSTNAAALLEVLALDVAARGSSRPLARRTVRRPVMSWLDLADRPDRVLQGEVAHDHARLDHPQHQVAGADLEHRGGLAHVGVADDDVQAAVALGVGVRLVAGVDDRPGAGGGARRRPPRCGRRAGSRSSVAPLEVVTTLPAPQMICRLTRNGISTSESCWNSPARPTR